MREWEQKVALGFEHATVVPDNGTLKRDDGATIIRGM
jgi:hypothetical protein